MEIWNFLWWWIFGGVGIIYLVIMQTTNNKMRYDAEHESIERSRRLEQGVLRNEQRYVVFASHIQKTIKKLMMKVYCVLIGIS